MRPAPPMLLAVLLALLPGCRSAPPAAVADAAEPDTALVAALGTLHLLEARQARFGDVPPTVRAAVLARYGFSEASLRRAVERAQQDGAPWEALTFAVDAWMGRPALDTVAARPDASAR